MKMATKFERRMKVRIADVRRKLGTKLGDKSLLCAINKGDINKIKHILRSGEDVNEILDFGVTPLLFAFYHQCNEEIIRTLIDFGADVNICDFYNMYPLRFALGYPCGKHNILLQLIEAGGDVNVRDSHNNTPLMWALQCKEGHQFVSHLISAGSDVNVVNIFHKTPLMYAIQNNCNVNIVSQLIENGADVDYCNCFGTPLIQAILNSSDQEIIVTLVTAGADVNRRDGCGRTPLTCISGLKCERSTCSNKEIIQLLLKNGANLKNFSEMGNSILHLANCHYLIDLLVCKYGVSVNVKNNRGETPLLKALIEDNVDKVRVLLSLGADCNISDKYFNSPLHCVGSIFPANFICEIFYNGALLDTVNCDGKLPLDLFLDMAFNFLTSNQVDLIKTIIKHYLLYYDEKIICQHIFSAGNVQFILSFLRKCLVELKKMKRLCVGDNITFYNFCNSKKTKFSKFVNISFIDYKYSYEYIQRIFPIYHDLLILRMKYNKIEKCHYDLIKHLERLIVRPSSTNEGCVFNFIKLNYDTLYNIVQYLSHKDLHCFILASTKV